MPSQVRIISPRNSQQWDDLVHDTLTNFGLERERDYGGVVNAERADKVRRCIRTAAKKRGIGSKVYWHECKSAGKCAFGKDCAYHVKFTLFDLDKARQYKAQQSAPRR